MKRTVTVVTVLGLLTLGVGIWFYQFTSRSEVVPEFPIEDATEAQATAALTAAEEQVAELRQLISDLKSAEASSPNLMRNVVLRKTGISGFGESMNEAFSNLKNAVGLFLEEHLLMGVTGVSAQENQCGFIVNNGDPSKKINFVFVAEKFLDKEEFLDRARLIVGLNSNDLLTLLNFRPYSEFKDDYNFYYYFVPDADYGCGPSSSEVMNDQRFCFNVRVALESLSESCGDWGLETDFIIMVSKKDFRPSANILGIEGTNQKVRILRFSNVGEEKGAIPPERFQNMIIHEFSHSLGSLSDEYMDLDKSQYKPIAGIRASNIDIAGCPKWCSGQLNTGAACYQDYLNYQSCITDLDVNDPNDDSLFLDCYNSIPSELPSCDLGVSCEAGSGCFFGAGGTNGFRSLENSIMRGLVNELGSVNERLARAYLREFTDSRKMSITQLKIELLTASFLQSIVGDDGISKRFIYTIEFSLKNQEGKPVILKDNSLNYRFFEPGGSVITRNLGNNDYILRYEHFVSVKDRPELNIIQGDKVNLTITAIYKEVSINKLIELDLYNAEVSETFINEAEAIQIARNAGLEDGIADWETSLHWFAGDLNTYVWTVQNTLSATPSGQAYAASGETIVIDANSGEVKKVLQWQGMTQSIPEPRSTSVPKEITVTQSIAQAEVSLGEAEAHLESAQDAFSAGNFNAVIIQSRQAEVVAITAHFTLIINNQGLRLQSMYERATRWGSPQESNPDLQTSFNLAESTQNQTEAALTALDLSNFLSVGNECESPKCESQLIALHASQEQAGGAINTAGNLLDFIVHGPPPEGDTPPTPPTEGSN